MTNLRKLLNVIAINTYNFLFTIGNVYIAAIEEIMAVIINVKNCPADPGIYVFCRK